MNAAACHQTLRRRLVKADWAAGVGALHFVLDQSPIPGLELHLIGTWIHYQLSRIAALASMELSEIKTCKVQSSDASQTVIVQATFANDA